MSITKTLCPASARHADRLIAVDKNGNIVDGDKVIATLAVEMKKKNLLK